MSVELDGTLREENEAHVQNRAARRKLRLDPISREKAVWTNKLTELIFELKSTGNDLSEAVAGGNKHITRIIYQGRPFVYHFLATRQNLPELLEGARGANLAKEFVDQEGFKISDIFHQEIGTATLFGRRIRDGVTLAQIENMPLPLSQSDIGRINLVYQTCVPLISWDNNRQIIREMLLWTAAQRIARPDEKLQIPPRLYPLYQRATNYFDYYTQYMTDMSMSEDEEYTYITSMPLTWPILAAFLGCYIPARLGISPSSAIKLFQEKATNSNVVTVVWKGINHEKSILGKLADSSRHAYRGNGLPQDLQPYQHYNDQMDRIAASILTEHYAGGLSGLPLSETFDQAANLLNRLGFYQEVLRLDIASSVDKRIEINGFEGSPIQAITLATQYSRP